MPLSHFTLARASGDVTYRFSARGSRYGKLAFRRDDADLWIIWHPAWGWCAMGEDGDPAGLPFGMPRSLQNGRPPQGPWVSRKGAAAHVYDLRWGAPC